MPYFRKRPILVEAIQFTGNNFRELQNWSNWKVRPPEGTYEPSKAVKIETLEGTMWARVGDWIVRGVRGEFYPVKLEIFEETYEEDEGYKAPL